MDKVFTDEVSGRDRNQPQLQAMLDYVREGDTVIASSRSNSCRRSVGPVYAARAG